MFITLATRTARRSARAIPVLFTVLLGACSQSSSGPPLVPVEGLVTLDDKLLSGASIMLIPSGEAMGQAGIGKSDASGRFSVTTVGEHRPGAAVGSYRVIISKKVNPDGTEFQPRPDQDPMLAAYKELLPPIYCDEAQSRLVANVPPGGTKTLEFKLSSKAK